LVKVIGIHGVLRFFEVISRYTESLGEPLDSKDS
jgi:hypothetical protein